MTLDAPRPAYFGMTPEQRASFEMFGFAEYRPYWPDVRLKQRDGSMKSWSELVKEYRDAE